MKIQKFHDAETNPIYPFCIEIQNVIDDGYIEVVDCLWFATESEQLEQFNNMLSEYCH
jgi:hypothetical protein